MRGNRPHRKDLNHKKITDIFTKLNISYFDLHIVGNNCPDIVFGLNKYNFLVEIKSEKGSLSKGQLDAINKWQGYIIVAHNFEDIIRELFTFSDIINDDDFPIIIRHIFDTYRKIYNE